MSRIGRLPVTIPSGVQVEIDGRQVTVQGPKGTLRHTVADPIDVTARTGSSRSPGRTTRARCARYTDCRAR